jgi:hypothetical protein
MRNLLFGMVVFTAVAACTESPSAPARPRAADGRVQRDLGCPPTIDCVFESGTIDVASVDVGGGSLTTPDGRTYFATDLTVFHLATIPPSPILPNLMAWNALVNGGAGFRAFIAHIGSIPPSPIIPPSPVIPPTPIRYQISAQITVGGRFLTDVTPVVTF